MMGSLSICPEAAARLALAASLLLPLASAGCRDATAVKVQGNVTLDGKPLAGATITFLPLDEKEGRAAGGRSEPEGSFRLEVMPGQYRVTVVMPDDDPANVTGGNPMEMDEKTKRAYFSKASPQGRALSAKQKTKKVSPIPALYGDALKTPLRETVPPNGSVKIELRSTVR
jgi:hypothetical protein